MIGAERMQPRRGLLQCAVAIVLSVAVSDPVVAQTASEPSPEQGTTCPPERKGEPPTLGGDSTKPLSERLAELSGVICPPAGIDRDMQVDPPGGGRLKVIPPPGSPGGDPYVLPK